MIKPRLLLPLLCAANVLSVAPHVLAAPPEPIQITVDASHLTTKKVSVRLTVPAKAGELNLVYPGWLPGSHSVEGPLENVAHIQMNANGKVVSWRRDPYNPFVLHVTVPEDASAVEVAYDYVFPDSSSEVFYGVAASENIAIINPAAFALAPEGDPHTIPVSLNLSIPLNWKYASALHGDAGTRVTTEAHLSTEPAVRIAFDSTSVYTMIDSPIMVGKFHQSIAIPRAKGDVAHTLELFAESDDWLKKQATLTPLVTRLVAESNNLFGARHYNDFHFMVALTDDIGRNGLEHHASVAYTFSPNDFDRVPGQIKASPSENWTANLLPHEFVHSWNGKFRRPYGEAVQSNIAPQSADLVWMYEGLTEYLGEVLMVRSGFETASEWRLTIGRDAADLRQGPGRDWQSIADAALVMPHTYQHGTGTSLRPVNDVYMESRLVWLEVDAIIRRESGGKKSLDDFCKVFFGGANNGAEVKPYTRADIIAALNQTQPYEWESFIEQRFYSAPKGLPVAGFDTAGWELRFTDAPREATADAETDLRFSLGFRVSTNGAIFGVIPGSLADRAGIKNGNTILGVNGFRFNRAKLREQIRATSKPDTKPVLDLLIADDARYSIVHLDSVHGEGYPVLVRREGKEDLLTAIVTPQPPTKP